MSVDWTSFVNNIKYELGGFIDPGMYDMASITKEELIFNQELANNYLEAMRDENFEIIGDMSSYFFRRIYFWLNYYEECDKLLNKYIPNEITTGLIKTKYDRTFSDAVIANCKGNLASQLINNGNYDIRLFATAIAYNEDDMIDVFYYCPETVKTKEEYLEFIQDVFSKLDEIYLICNNYKQEIKILKNIKLLFDSFIYDPEKFGEIKFNEIKFKKNYHWLEALKDKSKVKQLKLIPDKKGNLRIC